MDRSLATPSSRPKPSISRWSRRYWRSAESQSIAGSGLKLVFATLMQASERWQNVRMSEVEVAMLCQLRRQLGLEPPVVAGPSDVQRQAG